MFIAHFKSGKSISEKDCSWDDLPDKTEITCLQLVHTPSDLLFYFKDHMNKLIPVLSTDLIPYAKDIAKEIDEIIKTQQEFYEQKNKILQLLKLEPIIQKWTKDLKEKQEELKVVQALKEEEKLIDNVKSAVARIDYWLKNTNKIKNYSNFWKEQDTNCVSLTGSDKFDYYFFQFKHGNLAVRTGPKLTMRSDFVFVSPSQAVGMENQQYQEIGMIVNKEGNCICAKMDMVTGWTKIYYTTVFSLRLDLRDTFRYIDLEKIG